MISVDDKSHPWRESMTVSDLLKDLDDQYPYVVVRVNNKYISKPNFEKALIVGLGAIAVGSILDNGDEVVTNSGIYGFVTGVDGDRFWLEIDDDVQIRIAKAAVQGKVDTSTSDEPAEQDDEAADDADQS